MAFQDRLRKDIEIFLDDFCVYGREVDHPQALAHCFTQCSKFGISLNAAKCQFVVPYGKLLGHIVSVDGIGVDPDKITLIENFPRPQSCGGSGAFMDWLIIIGELLLPLLRSHSLCLNC